jgi:hypothetical protein
LRTSRTGIAGLIAAAAILAIGMAPGVFASGTIACLSPSSCSVTDTLNLSGSGSTGSATFWLYASNVPSGATVNYYVCPSSTSSCDSASGTTGAGGWIWSFTPTSGTVGNSANPSCTGKFTCEGNGVGSPSTLTLTVTAPTSSGYGDTFGLNVYACTTTGTATQCSLAGNVVASLGITISAPEFGAGMVVAVLLGLAAIMVAKRRSLPALPSVPTA